MSDMKLPSFEAIATFREKQHTLGYTFPLHATSLGQSETILIRARRITTMDRAAIRQLPTESRERVWAGIKALEAEQKKAEDLGEPLNLDEAAENNERILPAADAFCVAAFIEPILVNTEEERLRTPGSWRVDVIAPEDRVSFFYACMNPSSPAAKFLKMFRPAGAVDATAEVIDVTAGRSAPDAGYHAVMQVAPDPIRTVGVEGQGV